MWRRESALLKRDLVQGNLLLFGCEENETKSNKLEEFPGGLEVKDSAVIAVAQIQSLTWNFHML